MDAGVNVSGASGPDGGGDGHGMNAGVDARAPSGDAGGPRGWHKRGFLPHCDGARLYQMVTYRLGDSLPLAVAQRLADELDDEGGETRYRKRIESLLDAGHGECVLNWPKLS